MLTFDKVPWLSVEDEAFPPRAPRQKRRILRSLLAEPIVYPIPEPDLESSAEIETHQGEPSVIEESTETAVYQSTTQASTPLPSDAPSDTGSTQPTTPSSAVPAPPVKSQQTPTQPKARLAGPVLPAVPLLPPSPSAGRRAHRDSTVSTDSKLSETAPISVAGAGSTTTTTETSEPKASAEDATLVSQSTQPKSWANLFRSNESQASLTTTAISPATSASHGAGKGESLSDVLNDMNSVVEAPTKVAFLKPRGLVNTGNMCYMNSVSPNSVLTRQDLTCCLGFAGSSFLLAFL